MIGNRNVGLARQHQTQLRRMLLLETKEIIKERPAALVWIDAPAIQQIWTAQLRRLAGFGVDRHRHDPARQLSPQIGSQPALGFGQPD